MRCLPLLRDDMHSCRSFCERDFHFLCTGSVGSIGFFLAETESDFSLWAYIVLQPSSPCTRSRNIYFSVLLLISLDPLKLSRMTRVFWGVERRRRRWRLTLERPIVLWCLADRMRERIVHRSGHVWKPLNIRVEIRPIPKVNCSSKWMMLRHCQSDDSGWFYDRPSLQRSSPASGRSIGRIRSNLKITRNNMILIQLP